MDLLETDSLLHVDVVISFTLAFGTNSDSPVGGGGGGGGCFTDLVLGETNNSVLGSKRTQFAAGSVEAGIQHIK